MPSRKRSSTSFKAKVDELDKHIGRLQDMERIHVSRPWSVNGSTPDAAAQSRNGTGLSPIYRAVRTKEVEPWRAVCAL